MTEMGLNQFIYMIKDDTNQQYKNNIDSGLLPFIGQCIAHVKDSVSQNYQDIWALYENNFKKEGFFVEFGATDGVISSNTLLLEKTYKWTGILAEPNPVWHDELFENRSCHITRKCVFSQSGLTVDFLKTFSSDLSTIRGFGEDDQWKEQRKNAEVTQVETISLFDLLTTYNAPRVIDYLSIDTEGTEYGILNAFFQQNNDCYKLRTVTVEHNFTHMRDKIYSLMTDNGYERVYPEVSRWDDFYINRRI